jgi:hypothetical protein
MALNTSTIQPQSSAPSNTNTGLANDATALLSMLVLSVYAANKSKRQFRKMKRKFMWTAFKLKMKSFFSRRAISNRTLIYILLAVVFLALLAINAWIALAVALIALILILTNSI